MRMKSTLTEQQKENLTYFVRLWESHFPIPFPARSRAGGTCKIYKTLLNWFWSCKTRTWLLITGPKIWKCCFVGLVGCFHCLSDLPGGMSKSENNFLQYELEKLQHEISARKYFELLSPEGTYVNKPVEFMSWRAEVTYKCFQT